MDVDEAGRDDEAGRVELVRAAGAIVADLAIRPSAMATSARNGAAPVPSNTVPSRITMSAHRRYSASALDRQREPQARRVAASSTGGWVEREHDAIEIARAASSRPFRRARLRATASRFTIKG